MEPHLQLFLPTALSWLTNAYLDRIIVLQIHSVWIPKERTFAYVELGLLVMAFLRRLAALVVMISTSAMRHRMFALVLHTQMGRKKMQVAQIRWEATIVLVPLVSKAMEK
jgi:hypothetical protein